jgi:hypothetical protein
METRLIFQPFHNAKNSHQKITRAICLKIDARQKNLPRFGREIFARANTKTHGGGAWPGGLAQFNQTVTD